MTLQICVQILVVNGQVPVSQDDEYIALGYTAGCIRVLVKTICK